MVQRASANSLQMIKLCSVDLCNLHNKQNISRSLPVKCCLNKYLYVHLLIFYLNVPVWLMDPFTAYDEMYTRAQNFRETEAENQSQEQCHEKDIKRLKIV